MNFFPHKIELTAREDKFGDVYYFGTVGAPSTLSLKKGAVFFIFTSEEDQEELQIAVPKPGSRFSTLKKAVSSDGTIERIYINLEKKIDENGNPYYFAAVQDSGVELPMDEGLLFFAFTAKDGKEQLQISRNIQAEKNPYKGERNAPEVYRRREPLKFADGAPRRADYGT